MPDREATARIKINKLLEAAGWHFFLEGDAPANIRLEPSITIKSADPRRARRQLREDQRKAPRVEQEKIYEPLGGG